MAEHGEHANIRQIVAQLLVDLEQRWYARDSEGYAGYYHPDADFVDVMGRFHRGREAIARLQQTNFDAIYEESRLRLEPLTARKLTEDVALAHVKATLHVPAGPRAGDALAQQTRMLVRDGNAWQIRAVHNTFIQETSAAAG